MHAHHVFDFVMYVAFAVGALIIGFGQGLTFNVKGFTFLRAVKFSVSELLFVALAIFLVTRNVNWMAIVIGFLIVGMLIGFATTRHERPRQRYLSGGARPGHMVSGWKVPPPHDGYEESPHVDLYA